MMKRLCAVCPQCARQFAFELAWCPLCRVVNREGGTGGEIALWHLTQSAHGIVHHPPEWFGREAKLA